MKIPDNTDNNSYDAIATRYKQLRKKIKPWRSDAYIDATNNKQLFKEMRDIIIDIGQIMKNMYGIQKDDDVDAV